MNSHRCSNANSCLKRITWGVGGRGARQMYNNDSKYFSKKSMFCPVFTKTEGGHAIGNLTVVFPPHYFLPYFLSYCTIYVYTHTYMYICRLYVEFEKRIDSLNECKGCQYAKFE